MASLPTYKDLDIEECENQQTNNIKTTWLLVNTAKNNISKYYHEYYVVRI
jgi:hypothetical protein